MKKLYFCLLLVSDKSEWHMNKFIYVKLCLESQLARTFSKRTHVYHEGACICILDMVSRRRNDTCPDSVHLEDSKTLSLTDLALLISFTDRYKCWLQACQKVVWSQYCHYQEMDVLISQVEDLKRHCVDLLESRDFD